MSGPILYVDNHQILSVEVDGTLIGNLQVTSTGSLATTDTAVTVGSAVNVQVDGSVYSEVDAIYGSIASDTTIIVGAFGTVRGFDGIYLGRSGNIVINNGGISGSLSEQSCAAVKLESSENYVLNAGYLSGYYGIFATGLVSPAEQNLIVNSGTIQASAVGIRLLEDHSFAPSSSKSMVLSDYGVFTSGSIIAGEVGIEITHNGNVKNSGLVQAGDIGIAYTSGQTSLFNSGTIVAHIAYYGSSGGDVVTNQGRMQGDIFLTRTTTSMTAASASRLGPSTWEAGTTPPMAATGSKRSSAISATT